MTTAVQTRETLLPHSISGVIGGLAGGLAFALLMGVMDMLPMVAMLVGSESAIVGFIVHMAISADHGASFGLLFGAQSRTLGRGALWGQAQGERRSWDGSEADLPKQERAHGRKR